MSPRVTFATYPWAFEVPGGGEIQLLKYEQYLRAAGQSVARHDPWSQSLRSTDIVHFFSCISGSVHFCNYAKSQGIPLVVSASLWLTDETRHLYPIDEIRHQLHLADAIVTNGDIESDNLAHVLGLSRDKFHTVRNACDSTFLHRVDPELFRDRFGIKGPFLLNVGNVEPRKNQLALATASRTLGIPLIVVGHVRSQDYADASWAAGGDLVRYLGPIDHDDPLLRSAYAACELFCLPSTLETPGLTALEAAAAGARVLVTGHGSAPEYFGEYADYVWGSEPEDIVARLIAALERPVNPMLRQRVAEQFTWERVVEPLARLYEQLANCKRQSAMEAGA